MRARPAESARTAVLSVRNRQRTRPVSVVRLRHIARAVLEHHLKCPCYELGVHLVAAAEMARVNEQFLAHAGSTDVITFDHAEPSSGGALYGELFICLDDAVAQAREYGTSWPEEVVRYLIHGLLHLRGYDDRKSRARLQMKREEERLLRAVKEHGALSGLARRSRRRLA
jgi:probable rRNA maturation factor